MSKRLRSLLVVLVGGAALAFTADAVVRAPGFLNPRDFLEYWSAGRVNLRGGNPYHPAELLPEQRRADPDRTTTVMMWNPPPALAVYMPLGALGPRWAALLWGGIQLVAVFFACDLLWRAYWPAWFDHAAAKPDAHRWFAALLALSFVGTWWLATFGQNTGLLLLGLAGFLHFTKKGQPVAAGACAALTALKPHLLAAFGVLLVANVVTRAGAKSLAAGIAVIALACGVALVANPDAVTQFVEAVRHPAEGAVPLSGWVLPVPAYWLRMWLAPAHFWVQFVPCAVACAGVLVWRARAGASWNWPRALPLVVVISVLTTPYGGWIFDLPVLLVPVVWAGVRLVSAKRWGRAGMLVTGQAAITAVSFIWVTGLHAYGWVAFAVLLVCALTLGVKPRNTDYPRS